MVTIQVGNYKLRGGESTPIVATVTDNIAKSIAERAATLLVGCYNDSADGQASVHAAARRVLKA